MADAVAIRVDLTLRTAKRLQKRRLRIFVRTLDPHEGLEIDHVARLEVTEIASNRGGEFEQVRVGLPVRLRLIMEIEAVFLRRDLRHSRFEKNVAVRLRNEPEHGHERPG